MSFNNMDLRGKPQVTHLQWTMKVVPDEYGEGGGVGVMAEARLAVPIGGSAFHLINITSGGLWGVDGDGDYHVEVYREEKANLWAELQDLAKHIHGKTIIVEDNL